VTAAGLFVLQIVVLLGIAAVTDRGIGALALLFAALVFSFALHRAGSRVASRADQLLAKFGVAEAAHIGAARLSAQETVIAGVAHEINTPLGALKSNHDVTSRALGRLQTILEDDVVDETEIDQVRRIVRAIGGVQETNDLAFERMQSLVRGMRTFAGSDRVAYALTDLHEAIEGTLALLAHNLPDGIEFHRDFGDLPLVACGPDQIGQVMTNLILNASQAIEGKGTITLRTRLVGESVRMEVADTGVGIAPDHLPSVFEAGFTTKKGRMGMGMGLLVSERIVHQHGGRISVESILGQGTTFIVEVPITGRRNEAHEEDDYAGES
jgi:two-component system NtrC family sensor kinase